MGSWNAKVRGEKSKNICWNHHLATEWKSGSDFNRVSAKRGDKATHLARLHWPNASLLPMTPKETPGGAKETTLKRAFIDPGQDYNRPKTAEKKNKFQLMRTMPKADKWALHSSKMKAMSCFAFLKPKKPKGRKRWRLLEVDLNCAFGVRNAWCDKDCQRKNTILKGSKTGPKMLVYEMFMIVYGCPIESFVELLLPNCAKINKNSWTPTLNIAPYCLMGG